MKITIDCLEIKGNRIVKAEGITVDGKSAPDFPLESLIKFSEFPCQIDTSENEDKDKNLRKRRKQEAICQRKLQEQVDKEQAYNAHVMKHHSRRWY